MADILVKSYQDKPEVHSIIMILIIKRWQDIQNLILTNTIYLITYFVEFECLFQSGKKIFFFLILILHFSMNKFNNNLLLYMSFRRLKGLLILNIEFVIYNL